MKLSLVIVAIVFYMAPAHGEWWFYPDAIGKKSVKHLISDTGIEFNYGGITCGAKETKFMRISDGNIIEYRDLFCRTADDTLVGYTVNCKYPGYVFEGITVTKGAASYSPALTCGPSK